METQTIGLTLMDRTYRDLADLLLAERERLGITAEQLARAVGLSKQTVRNIEERTARTSPRLETIEAFYQWYIAQGNEMTPAAFRALAGWKPARERRKAKHGEQPAPIKMPPRRHDERQNDFLRLFGVDGLEDLNGLSERQKALFARRVKEALREIKETGE